MRVELPQYHGLPCGGPAGHIPNLPTDAIRRTALHEAAHAVVRWVVDPLHIREAWLWDRLWVSTVFNPPAPAGGVENMPLPGMYLRQPDGERKVWKAEAMTSAAGPLLDLLDGWEDNLDAALMDWRAAREEDLEGDLEEGCPDWDHVEYYRTRAPGLELADVAEATLRVLHRPEVQQAIRAIADKLLEQEPDEDGRLSLEWDDVVGLLPEVGTDPGSDEENPDSTCSTWAP